MYPGLHSRPQSLGVPRRGACEGRGTGRDEVVVMVGGRRSEAPSPNVNAIYFYPPVCHHMANPVFLNVSRVTPAVLRSLVS